MREQNKFGLLQLKNDWNLIRILKIAGINWKNEIIFDKKRLKSVQP